MRDKYISAVGLEDMSDIVSYWCSGVYMSDINLDALGYSARSYV